MARRAGAARGFLDRRGELVEGEAGRTADLEDTAPGGRVGDGVLGEGGDVGHGDEVDWIVPVPEDDGPA